LNTGSTSEYTDANAAKFSLDDELRIPALLTVPEDLWETKELIRNGSASMVFKGNATVMRTLISRIRPRETLLTGFDSCMSSFNALCTNVMRSNEPERCFYLKIRLKDTSLRGYPIATSSVVKACHENVYNVVYPIDPVGDREVGIFLMNDCGAALHESSEFALLNYGDFRRLYRSIWLRTIAMCNDVFHGDALPHNMVYNSVSREIVLIDLDEAVYGISAPRRVIQEVEGERYPYLCYPNVLRCWSIAQVYTEIQLVASFLLLYGQFVDASNSAGRSIVGFHAVADEANKFLKKPNDCDKGVGVQVRTDSRITDLISKARELIGIDHDEQDCFHVGGLESP